MTSLVRDENRIAGIGAESTLTREITPVKIDPTTDRLLVDTGTVETLSEFNTNAIDDMTTTSTTYICKEDKDGNWLFTKIDETGSFPVITYASITNNPTQTTYALAYASRTSLTYEVYSLAQ